MSITRRVSAQRLTASKVMALKKSAYSRALSEQCSTPNGIKGNGTPVPTPKNPFLNSAQRLTASKVMARRRLEALQRNRS